MRITITQESPASANASTLIGELDDSLEALYPIQSRNGFSVERLVSEKVAFFVIRVDDVSAGCGGVKIFPNEYAEVKRMWVRPQFRGQGLATQMLDHLRTFSIAAGVQLLRLETGIYQTEAIRLYEKYGFRRVPPFGEYRDDPLSLCYELGLGK